MFPNRCSTRTPRIVKCAAWLAALPVFSLAACAGQPSPFQEFFSGQPRVTSQSQESVGQQQRDLFEGRKPRVAVIRMDNRSGVQAFRNGKHVGQGMQDQLLTALGSTDAFSLVEREMLADIQKEIELNNGAGFRASTATRAGGLEGADFLVIGSVTEIQESQAAAGGGINLLHPSPWQIAAGAIQAGAGFSKDHVAIDLRVVDGRTGGLVGSYSVTGGANNYEAALGSSVGSLLGAFNVNAGGHYSVPMQSAIRSCMIQAVERIVQSIQGSDWYRSHEAPGVAGDAPENARVMIEVTIDEAKFKVQPNENAIALVTLAKGDQVEFIDQQGDWVEVRLADGRTGWVKSTSFPH